MGPSLSGGSGKSTEVQDVLRTLLQGIANFGCRFVPNALRPFRKDRISEDESMFPQIIELVALGVGGLGTVALAPGATTLTELTGEEGQ